MRFVLIGNDFPAAQTLDLLLRSGKAEVVMAFTDTAGPSSAMLRQKAERAGVPLHTSAELRQESGIAQFQATPFDWLININSTVLLPRTVLERPRYGALNMHPGLLPEYSGLHVHQWALMNGEQEAGATVHYITPQVDAGDIVAQERVPIDASDTGLSLFMKCVRAGTEAMEGVLAQIVTGEMPDGTPQDLSKRRLYRLRDLPDGRIDWSKPAAFIERFVRAGNYEPVTSPSFTAHFTPDGGETLEALRVTVEPGNAGGTPGTVLATADGEPPVVACGDGNSIRLTRVRKKSGRAVLSVAELNNTLPAGSIIP